MAASIASLAAILKDFYLGPIQEQLNNEVLALELFEKEKNLTGVAVRSSSQSTSLVTPL